MNKANFILVLLFLFVFMNCRDDKEQYTFRASPNFYFQPNFLDTVEYKGQLNKAGIAEGEWEVILGSNKTDINIQSKNFLNLEYVIPGQFDLKKKASNDFLWYTYNDESIMIFLDTIKSLDLKGAEIILNEISGLSQICVEETNCIPIDYQGNIIKYERDYFSGVYHFIERKDDKPYHKLGYVAYNNNQLILFVYQFSENSDVKLNQSLFSLLVENIRVNEKNLVPPMTKFEKMLPMNFSSVLKSI